MAALERLYLELRVPVFGAALAITADRRAAEDVLQETFVRVYRSAGRYERRSRARAWVLTIARNVALDHVRRRSREAAAADRDAPGALPEATLERLVVTEALLTLERPEREIVALHELGGLTHAEIAERLALPAGTVRWKYRIALGRLRSLLVEVDDGRS